jgi:PAS domain S-box-containing protein
MTVNHQARAKDGGGTQAEHALSEQTNLSLLLVEDSVQDAELVQMELLRAGLRVEIRRVETEEDFRREIQAAPPDLILADYSLPRFGALGALAVRRELCCQVPLILVTGSTSEEIAVQCLREGAEDYIIKSALKRLPGAVKNALTKRRAEEERRAAESALCRSEEQFRLITENTRDLVCLLDLNGRFLYASPSFAAVLNRPVQTLLGTLSTDLVHPDDIRRFREALDEALFFREGRNVEMRFGHAQGGWLSVESALNYIFDEAGRPQRALVAARDTSDRKRAEKEIRKLAAFPRFNPNPVLEFGADGTLTYFNDAALEMARSLKKNHPQSILPLNTATIVKLCLSTGQKKLHHDTNIAGRVVSWSFFPVIAHQLVHCYAEDVTERLNLEAQLRQVQKMDSVGQLAAGVAHDFNNILTIIQGHAGLLNMETSLPEAVGESSRQIALAAERAANLTRQLLLFSRKQILQPQLLNLNEVVNDLSKMLRALLGEQVALKRHMPEELASVYADPSMMEQILVNLSVNARDAMPRGGTLSISTYSVEIDVGYVQRHPEARVGDFICFSVSDTGHGMDAKTLSRIFEPFFTTKEIGKGTGLGLATVYGIVSQHQGWIEVESQVGHGTRFKIYLPQATKAAQKTGASKPKEIPGGDETILVVEDETPLRELVQEILQKKGYRVLSASNGVEALGVWQKHRSEIHLVLTDMMMPEGVSGRDLAEHVQRERSDVKVIYSSGYSLDVVGIGPVLQDGTNFLQKPYDPETLTLTVRNSLDLRP